MVWPLPRVPAFRMAFILACGLAVLGLSIYGATRVARPDHSLEAGHILQSATQQMEVIPLDLTPEPGEISDNTQLTTFFQRQDQITKLLQEPQLRLITPKGTQPLQLTKIKPTDLPLLFWIQITVGLGAFLIAGWIFSLRAFDRAAQYFFLSACATLLFTCAAAIYTTRALALPTALFRPLVAINVLGASLFGIATIALFSIYPRRLLRGRMLINTWLLVFILWTALALMGVLPPTFGVNLITVTEMLVICGALTAQFLASRGDLRARASLTWLGLSVFLGAGFFITLNAVPLVFGQNAAVEQGYAFLSFLLIYLGLAAGISRYQLLEVGRWAYRFLFYALGFLLLLLLDALLIMAADLEQKLALSLSFFIVGLLYFPLRDVLREKLTAGKHLKAHELMEGVLEVAFAANVTERQKRWRKFLGQVFDPLEIKPLAPPAPRLEIIDEGLSLRLPAIGLIPSMQLSYRASGRLLFNRDALHLADRMLTLVARAESGRESYDRGVIEERRRMAQDLHDDVGARLLTAIHQSEEKSRPALKAVLADLREIVGEMNSGSIALGDLLAELRYECSRRLALLDINLEWPLNPEQSTAQLDYREQKALRSALRELISNVIKHAAAKNVRVRTVWERDELQLHVEDDGRGLPVEVQQGEGRGYGFTSVQRRMVALGGSFEWASSAQGLGIVLKMPSIH